MPWWSNSSTPSAGSGDSSAVDSTGAPVREAVSQAVNSSPVSPKLKSLSSKLSRSVAGLKINGNKQSREAIATTFTKAETNTSLFKPTDPTVDGEDCLHDCSTCSVKLPNKFSIDESDKLYGFVNGWETHLIVATGKSDWVRDVADEEGSVMQAISKKDVLPTNGKMMLSASNIPVPEDNEGSPVTNSEGKTKVLLLPAWQYFEGVGPADVQDLVQNHINKASTNTTPFGRPASADIDQSVREQGNGTTGNAATSTSTAGGEGAAVINNTSNEKAAAPSNVANTNGRQRRRSSKHSIKPSLPTALVPKPLPHKYLILMCSQKTRDARCGQSAPLLYKEFARHLRPLGLFRDLEDERPGGVGMFFISHVGGHKYSANIMVYRRGDVVREDEQREAGNQDSLGEGRVWGEEQRKAKENDVIANAAFRDGAGEDAVRQAGQCIWLARVRPEDCENIVKYTVLRGKVVKPDRQLRGGFDRWKGLTSW